MGSLGRGGETSEPQVQRWIITPPASGAVDSVEVKGRIPSARFGRNQGIIPLPDSVDSVEIKGRVPLPDSVEIKGRVPLRLPLPASSTVDSVKVEIHRDSTDVPLAISMQFPPHIRMQVPTPSDDNPVDSVKVQVLGSRADTLKVFMQRSPDIPIQVAAPGNTIMLKHLDDSAD